MIDIFALEKIKRITTNAYFNEDKLTQKQLYDMLMNIRKLVK